MTFQRLGFGWEEDRSAVRLRKGSGQGRRTGRDFLPQKNNRLAIRKMQIRTAMQYHFAHTKVAPIKMSDNDECG